MSQRFFAPLYFAVFAAFSSGTAAIGQAPGQRAGQQSGQQYNQQSGQPAARVATRTVAGSAAGNPAGNSPPATAAAPFPPQTAATLAQLQRVLAEWQTNSQGTKTLEAKFKRWHYSSIDSPNPSQHVNLAEGVIKYVNPDRGEFRVDNLVSLTGMNDGKPEYKQQPGQYGEHWVCDGNNLMEFDRAEKKCTVQPLPESMKGQGIINSPLPFVFNLDAERIQQRYWVRQVEAPQGTIVIEAWPKRQEDRSQYKLVQIALDGSDFTPKALIMYAPNFDPKESAVWDHYEFRDVKRNAIGASLLKLTRSFLTRPPAGWEVVEDDFLLRTQP